MQESKFEDEVQRSLEGLKVHPSTAVWNNLEKALRQRKRRRFILFFFTLAGFVLLGSAGYFYFTNPKKDIVAGHDALVESQTTSSANKNIATENLLSDEQADGSSASNLTDDYAADGSAAPIVEDDRRIDGSATPIVKDDRKSDGSIKPLVKDDRTADGSATPIVKDDRTKAENLTAKRPSANATLQSNPSGTTSQEAGSVSNKASSKKGSGKNKSAKPEPSSTASRDNNNVVRARDNDEPNKVAGSRPTVKTVVPSDAGSNTGVPSYSKTATVKTTTRTDGSVATSSDPVQSDNTSAKNPVHPDRTTSTVKAPPQSGNTIAKSPVQPDNTIAKATDGADSSIASASKVVKTDTITPTVNTTAQADSIIAAAKIKKPSIPSFQWVAGLSIGAANLGKHKSGKSASVSYADVSSNPINSPQNTPGIPTNAAAIQSPSESSAGLAFQASFGAQLPLSRRSSLYAGVGYSYSSNRIRVGEYRNLALQSSFNPAYNLTARAYTGYPAKSFTDKYHFISLPVRYQFIINPASRLRVQWNAGITPSYLVASDALVYSTAFGGSYSHDKNAYNRFQLAASMGFELLSGSRSKLRWSVGPEISYSLRKLSDNPYDNKQHLYYGGISGRIYFRK